MRTRVAAADVGLMFVRPRRYMGLQVGYKVMGVVLLVLLGRKAQRTQEYCLEKRPEGLL